MANLLAELANFTALHEKAVKSLVLHLVERVGVALTTTYKAPNKGPNKKPPVIVKNAAQGMEEATIVIYKPINPNDSKA